MTREKIIWQPEDEYLNSRLCRFAEQNGIDKLDWRGLVNRSVENIDWFWDSFLQFAGVQWSKPYDHLLDDREGLPWTKWFIGGETNIAYNCLDWHTQPTGNLYSSIAREKAGAEQLALIWENEAGHTRQITYSELNEWAGKVASLLKQLDVQAGDAVGIYMPMVPEVLAILFGCFKIGAVAVPVFSGFGSDALSKRMLDAQAKIIFTADGGMRRGKILEIKKDVDQIHDSVPSLKKVIVLKYIDNDIEWNEKDICFEEAIINLIPTATQDNLPAEHPSLYLYTSGTTGKPKGTIHTHAGAMAQIAKELGLVFDLKKADRFFWLTDIGWMMGPWEMIGVTFWGGTLVMYDGAPDYPNPDRLWELIDKYKVTTLGVSPTAIRVLKIEGEPLIAQHDLSSLKFLGSTGELWDDQSYMWFFDNVGGKRCPIMNISGGTELIGCLLTPLPNMPIPVCSLGTRGLAMDVDVYDEKGTSQINTIGQLVLKKPAPSLTKGFLGDKQRYLDTYFKQNKNIWYHGDWAKKTNEDYWYLFGRSDDTIKIAGKRIGPGEIESVLNEFPAVKESAAIGIPDEIKGEALVCFVVLKNNAAADVGLIEKIIKHLGTKLGATAKPKILHFVDALPKTRSGKVVRSSIKKHYLGLSIEDISSIENQQVLQTMPRVDKHTDTKETNKKR